MRKLLGGIIFLLVCMIALTGCARSDAPVAAPDVRSAYLSVVDSAGRTVIMPKKPERIVPLSSSFIELLYAAGGKAAGKPGSTLSSLPPAAQALPEVGHVANINLERLLALQPDLVIGYQGMHERFIPLLEGSRIPFIIVRMKTYEDVIGALTLFGSIAGAPEQAEQAAGEVARRIQTVVARLPEGRKKAAILHATARSVTLQLDASIAGNVANLLKLDNIATGQLPIGKNLDAVPFSMEKLVEADPDYIFIAFTGNLSHNEKRINDEVRSNPAWNRLRAVRGGQVYYLPMELFLLNPGLRYDEAVLYMAKLVYPEIYGAVNGERQKSK